MARNFVLRGLVVAAALVVCGCYGVRSDGSVDERDAHAADVSRDAGEQMSEPDGDSGAVGGDVDAVDVEEGACGGECGENAECVEGTCECESGYAGDPYAACREESSESCSTRSECGQFSVCISGECRCEPGFQPESGSSDCERPTVGSPADRSKERVCQRWNRVSSELTEEIWETEPQDTCDPGELKAKVQWEAMRSTNGYRWFVGLEPVESVPELIEANQKCATLMAANGEISHTPPSDWECYTEDGATAAGNSNLAQTLPGFIHPAETVWQYIRDKGNRATMGHRRWIFNPTMAKTGFGHRGLFGCMHATDRSGSDSKSVIRYPSRGPFPKEAIKGPWNYLVRENTVFSTAEVTVTNTDSGASMSVQNLRSLEGRYGRTKGIIWDVPNAESGETYRVEITKIGIAGDASTSYETTLVDCP